MEEAATQAGIPITEVFDYVNSRMAQVDTLNFELRLAGQGAIKEALKKLMELTQGSAREGQHFESTDLEAAKALAKFGIDALKFARQSLAPRVNDGDVEKDLFDIADPWTLRKIE